MHFQEKKSTTELKIVFRNCFSMENNSTGNKQTDVFSG